MEYVNFIFMKSDAMISIISVVYNDAVALEKTIASVKKQKINSALFEYVVVDGNSTDETPDIIKKNIESIDIIHSENDHGIYDAMNKGINITTGDWILFLNAGDILASENIIDNVVNTIISVKDSNFIYSDCIVNDKIINQEFSLKYLISRMINHQNIIYHRSLFKNKYNISYNICADYAHLLSVYESIVPKKLVSPISVFDVTGISSMGDNKHLMWLEKLRAVWSSPLSFPKKILLSSRGIVMLPLQYSKFQIRKLWI